MKINMVNNLTPEEIEEIIKNNIDGVKEVKATDLKGGDHWQVDIIAEAFNQMPTIKKHKLVYKALAEPLASEAIHALVINAKGTEE